MNKCEAEDGESTKPEVEEEKMKIQVDLEQESQIGSDRRSLFHTFCLPEVDQR